MLANHTCPAQNTPQTEQSHPFSFSSGNYDLHEIGWIIAGVAAGITLIISCISVFMHARNYYVPLQQRQITRILLMPAVYAIVSFFSYRYYRSYTYYTVTVTAYESLVVAAFLMLLLQYIGDSPEDQKEVLRTKDKRKLPLPLCCFRYRPSKPYFRHALMGSVLQYSFIRPIISLISIICEAYNVLCPTQYSIYYADVYLESADFVSISVALYGLITLYGLTKDHLKGRKPLAKFLCIKAVVFLVFYQGFIFSVLITHGVIKPTQYWTATNVADGLNAFCVCCEMVIISAAMMWAYSWKEYSHFEKEGVERRSFGKALLDCINYWDFVIEGMNVIKFIWAYIRGQPGTHSNSRKNPGFDMGVAFGYEHGSESYGDRQPSMRELSANANAKEPLSPRPNIVDQEYGQSYAYEQQPGQWAEDDMNGPQSAIARRSYSGHRSANTMLPPDQPQAVQPFAASQAQSYPAQSRHVEPPMRQQSQAQRSMQNGHNSSSRPPALASASTSIAQAARSTKRQQPQSPEEDVFDKLQSVRHDMLYGDPADRQPPVQLQNVPLSRSNSTSRSLSRRDHQTQAYEPQRSQRPPAQSSIAQPPSHRLESRQQAPPSVQVEQAASYRYESRQQPQVTLPREQAASYRYEDRQRTQASLHSTQAQPRQVIDYSVDSRQPNQAPSLPMPPSEYANIPKSNKPYGRPW